MAVAQPSGALVVKYLLGLGFLIAGLALLLVGAFEHSALLMLVGGAVSAFGAFLVVLKIIARNQPH